MSESRKGEAITQESLKEAMKSQFQRTLTEEEASAMIQEIAANEYQISFQEFHKVAWRMYNGVY